MTDRGETFGGSEGRISVRVWKGGAPHHIVVLAHGYGEHVGRYEHVALALVARGACVFGPDHLGHGHSDGERVLIADLEHVVDDLHHVVTMALDAHHGLPVILIGHSMGGAIATRYAQRYPEGLAGLVLSGPALGGLDFIDELLAQPEIPHVPIDPAVLSRDPLTQNQYATDPLVWHGSFKRPTLAAIRVALDAIASGASFGGLPTLYLHGADDELVPLAGTRTAIARLRGTDFTERIYEGARHEVFNEINREDVLREVCDFIDRVMHVRA